MCPPVPMPEEEPERVPDARGRLDPPRRNPPTAVGLADWSPAPRRPVSPRRWRPARRHRVSRAMLGTLMVLAGGAVSLTSVAGFMVGTVTMAAGTRMMGRALRPAH